MNEDDGYRIEISGPIVRLAIRGHWRPETTIAFTRDLIQAFADLRRRGRAAGSYLTLIDGTAYEVQSQRTVASFSRLLTLPEFASRRLAIVTRGALARLQIARIAQLDHHRIFDTDRDATTWLKEERRT